MVSKQKQGKGIKEFAQKVYKGAQKIHKKLQEIKPATRIKQGLKFTGLDKAVPGFVNTGLDIAQKKLGYGDKIKVMGMGTKQRDQFSEQKDYLNYLQK